MRLVQFPIILIIFISGCDLYAKHQEFTDGKTITSVDYKEGDIAIVQKRTLDGYKFHPFFIKKQGDLWKFMPNNDFPDEVTDIYITKNHLL